MRELGEEAVSFQDVKYWVNAIPKTTCALFSDVSDLEKGSTLVDILSYAAGGIEIPYADSCTSWTGVVSVAINFLVDQFGWKNLPAEMRESSFASKLSSKYSGEFGPSAASEASMCLLKFLYEKYHDSPALKRPKGSVYSTESLLKPNRETSKRDRKFSNSNNDYSSKTKNIDNNTKQVKTGEGDLTLPQNSSEDVDGFKVIRSKKPSMGGAKSPASVKKHIRFHFDDEHLPNDSKNISEDPNPAPSKPMTSSESVVHQKYRILNRDPDEWINRDDLDLVFSEKPTAKHSRTNSQRQQYLDKRRSVQIRTEAVTDAQESSRPRRAKDPNFDEGINDSEKKRLLQWLRKDLGVHAIPSLADDEQAFDANDDWTNGVLLSEVAAALNRHDKNLVKEIALPHKFVQDSRGEANIFDPYRRVVKLSSGVADSKPRLLLKGSELHVKSKAQAIRNTQVSLKLLSSLKPRRAQSTYPSKGVMAMTKLEDLELILPEDLVMKRRSLWPIVKLICSSFAGVKKAIRSSPRSHSAPPRAQHTRSTHKQSNDQSSGPTKTRLHLRSLTPTGRRPYHRQQPPESPDAKAVKDLATRASQETPGETARRHIRTISPQKSRAHLDTPSPSKASRLDTSPLKKTPIARPHLQKSKENINENVPVQDEAPPPRRGRPRRSMYRSEPMTAQELEQREKRWDDSWNSQRDREALWDITNTAKEAPKPLDPGPSSEPCQCHKRPIRRTKRKERWYPPNVDNTEEEHTNASPQLASQDNELAKLPVIYPQQQLAIKKWVYSLGISIREGEGGFVSSKCNSDSSSSQHLANLSTGNVIQCASLDRGPPLPESAIVPLKEDRLRNGVFLCELIGILEPNASRHTQLLQLVRYKPVNVAEAMENIQRALWLLRIRKSPPIPVVFLSHPKAILQANRSILWGLLAEMMQAYPPLQSSNSNGEISDAMHFSSKVLSLASSIPPSSSSKTQLLPYTIEQRRALDASLVHWLVEEDILRGISKASHISEMPSLLSLETCLRDGTLFCLLVGKIVGSPVVGWSRKSSASGKHAPLSTKVRVSNMQKCLQVLRSKPLMSTRFLYSGVEEDIVKGEWNAILGLLEDLHRYRDKAAPRNSLNKSSDSSSPPEEPYLGQEPHMNWPPPLSASDPLSFPSELNFGPRQEKTPSGVDLQSNITTADVVAFEKSQVNQPTESEKSRHFLNFDHKGQSVPREPNGESNSTDDKLVEAINSNSWKNSVDLFPSAKGTHQRTNEVTRSLQHDLHASPTLLLLGQMTERGDTSDASEDSKQPSDLQQPNAVRQMRQMAEERSLHRRAGDIIPARLDASLSHSSSPEETSETSIAQRVSFDSYKLPANWERIPSSGDIEPSASIPGGFQPPAADLAPSRCSSTNQAESLSARDTMSAKHRPSELRVQAAMSRGAKSTPSSASPRPRQRQPRQHAWNNQSSHEDFSMTADSLAPQNSDNRSSRHAQESYGWVEDMKAEESRRLSMMKPLSMNTPAKSNAYDDHISVSSTPPDRKHSAPDSHALPEGGKTTKELKRLRNMKLMQEATNALRWIASLKMPCHLPILSPLDGIQPDGKFLLPAFSDGVLLCQMIQHLERMPQPLRGYCSKPKSRAQKVQNIRRALEALCQKPDFSVHIRTLEEDILHGKGESIVGLLVQMKESYKHFKTGPVKKHHQIRLQRNSY